MSHIKDSHTFSVDIIQSNINDILMEYSVGKRLFDKYDIEDNYDYFFE